jgi:phosphoribulokinase
MTDWSYIDHFRTLKSPQPADVIALESALEKILNDLDSNAVHIESGYSKKFPRYITDIEVRDDHSNVVKHLRKHYWARYNQLQNLDQQIKKREQIIKSTCDHAWEKDWESRDHRSRYDCKKCGAYR